MKSSQLCSSSTVVCKQALFEQSAKLPWLKAENRVAVDAYIFLVPIGRARLIGMCVRNPLAVKI